MLRTTSTALFFYSKIIHLPSEHITIVWLVDSHVPLFGIKFTILFTICLILFFILLQFTLSLLLVFTMHAGYSLHLKLLTDLNPLLDAAKVHTVLNLTIRQDYITCSKNCIRPEPNVVLA